LTGVNWNEKLPDISSHSCEPFKRMTNIDNSPFRVKPGRKISLAAYNPAGTSLMPDKAKAAEGDEGPAADISKIRIK
jgi:hypothetical protein